MAKGIKYTTTFKTLKENTCVVDVLVDGFTGTATTLTGGVEPLELETNAGSHEWLSPVMLTSGYLRLWMEESQVRGMIPISATSHMVRLKIDNVVKWTGYLKQQALTSDLYEGAGEYEFPLWCPLSVLDTMNLTFDVDESMTSIGRLIWRILGMLEDITYGTVFVANNMANITTVPELSAIVDTRRFFDVLTRKITGLVNDMEEQYYASNATCLDILKEICKFWGWTMLLDNGNIYLLAPDAKAGYRYLLYGDLENITGTTQATTQNVSTISLASQTYLTTDHQYTIDIPKNKVVVKSSVEAEENIFEVNVEQAGQFAGFPNRTQNLNGNITADCASGYGSINNLLADGIYLSWDGKMGNDATTETTLAATDAEQNLPLLRKYDKFSDSSITSKKEYSWRHSLFLSRIFSSEMSESVYRVLKIGTAESYSFTDCALVLEADIKGKHEFWASMDTISGQDNRLYCCVAVGDKQWDATNSQWVDKGNEWRPAWFVVPIGSNNSPTERVRDGRIVRNTAYDTPYQGADGYAIPVNTPLYGRMLVLFRWMQYPLNVYDTITNWQWYLISNLKLRAVGKVLANYNWRKPENENSYIEDLHGVEEESVDLKLKTWNNTKYGSGLLIQPGGGWLTSVPFVGGSERPEYHLVQRMKALYGQSTEWRDIVIEDTYDLPYAIGKWNYTDSDGTWALCGFTRKIRSGELLLSLGKLPAS